MADSNGKYSTLKVTGQTAPRHRMEIPDGAWVKCKACGRTLYRDQLAENLYVCTYCACHLAMSVSGRIRLLTDPESFQEIDKELTSVDTLGFIDSKPYTARIAENGKKTGMNDAVICGSATLEGLRYMLGVMDFRYMGASMGSVVGEKITRLVEKATAEKTPVVLVTASGGARMQEGILSLMQMAKTSGALERHAEAGLGYIVLMTNPTYGGVTASFATLGDVILAEPGAMIGFAGPRVIQETTNSKLPENFQTAEFLLEKGLIDRVVDRKVQRKELAQLLEAFGAPKA
ncbi:MAG: acetyl-CoA carboxylase carboxyltransferase subunit beta [Lentisphaerae bacterium]|nr:acetyl-CoA carboxylase carboxyltransferase subunit beta [Lentisphaerota bacterium]